MVQNGGTMNGNTQRSDLKEDWKGPRSRDYVDPGRDRWV